MCGIAGGYKVDVNEQNLMDMVQAMKHRGPDDNGHWLDTNCQIGLGHARLSIIDLTASGHQPMLSSSQRFVISFNGEIYNYRSLRTQLAQLGVSFQSSSDTEVLLAAFEQWGVECLPKLEGMFGFALYDKQEDRLLLARDRFGEKPLYYYVTDKVGIWFASELKGLLASGQVPRKLNTARLGEWLALQTVHHPNSLVKEVYVLPPASYLVIQNGKVSTTRYWKPLRERGEVEAPTAQRKVRELLVHSVEQRLVSDVPVGAFLSGGIDSTVLVGVASAMHKQFNTYTVAFDDAAFKDGYYAAIAAKKFGTNHHEIKLSMAEVLQQVPDALAAIDHPSADGVNSYIVSKAVRAAGIKVALSGLGGDELFGGYASFGQLASIARYAPVLKLIPRMARGRLGRAMVTFKPTIPNRKRQAFLSSDLSLEGNYLLTRRYFFDDQAKKLLGKSAFDMPDLEADAQAWPYASISRFEMDFYMHDVLLRDTDQMSMKSSLEVRCPFLDSELAKYVWSLPDELKKATTINKPLLVNAMRDFIPDELVSRPKQGFSMPFDRWMRNELRSFCESKLSELKSTGVVSPNAVDQVWLNFLKGHPSVNWARVWLLVSLSSWMQTHRIET